MRTEPAGMLQDFNASEINSFRRFRTASGPGSPSGQPVWGGGCDRIIFHLSFDIFHLPFVSQTSPVREGLGVLAYARTSETRRMKLTNALILAESENQYPSLLLIASKRQRESSQLRL